MRTRLGLHALLGSAVAFTIYVAGSTGAGAQSPLAIDSARITINGTSNIHAYTASTTAVRVTRGQLAGALGAADSWANAMKPGSLEAFEVTIPVATLTSPKEGLDANMHKALQVTEHPDIVFRFLRFESGYGPAPFRAIGVLKIAGVSREVGLDITTDPEGSCLTVRGRVQLLMTDFGIKPPVAMLGMLRTDPKVTVTFETTLSVPLFQE